MNNMKITFEGEMLKRWKETTKAGKEMFYIAVKVPRGEYADVFKIKARDAETVKPYAVGTSVSIEAFVGGREWTNPETGKTSYFTDLNLFKIANAAKPAASEPEVVQADEVDDMPF